MPANADSIEILWTAIASIGIIYALVGMAYAYRDITHKLGLEFIAVLLPTRAWEDVPDEVAFARFLLARKRFRQEFFRVQISLFHLASGVAAMSLPTRPGPTQAVTTAIKWMLVYAAILNTLQSVLDHYAEKRLRQQRLFNEGIDERLERLNAAIARIEAGDAVVAGDLAIDREKTAQVAADLAAAKKGVEGVASDLAESHSRAHATPDDAEPGAAADAASKPPNGASQSEGS